METTDLREDNVHDLLGDPFSDYREAIQLSQNLESDISSLSERINSISKILHSSVYQLTEKVALRAELEDLQGQVRVLKNETEKLYKNLNGTVGVSREALETKIRELMSKTEFAGQHVEKINIAVKNPILEYLVKRLSSYVGIDQKGLRELLERLGDVEIQKIKDDVDGFIVEASSEVYSGLKKNVSRIFSSENMPAITSLDTLVTAIKGALRIYKLMARCHEQCGNNGPELLSVLLSRVNSHRAFVPDNEGVNSNIISLVYDLFQRADKLMPNIGDQQRKLVDSMSIVVMGKVYAGLQDIIKDISATKGAFDIALDSRDKYLLLAEIYSRFKSEINIEGIYKEQYHSYFEKIESLKGLCEKEMSISTKDLVGCAFNGGCDFKLRGDQESRLKSKIMDNAKRLSGILNGEIEILKKLCDNAKTEALEKEITNVDNSLKNIFTGVDGYIPYYDELVVNAYDISQRVYTCIGKTNTVGEIEMDVSNFDADVVKILFDVLKALNKSLVFRVSEK